MTLDNGAFCMLSSLVTGNWARLPFMGLRVHGRKKNPPRIPDTLGRGCVPGPCITKFPWATLTSHFSLTQKEKPSLVHLFAGCYDILCQAVFPDLTPRRSPKEVLWSISDHPSSYPCPAGLAVLVVLLVAFSTPTSWQTNVCHPPPPTGAGPPEDKDLDINLYMNHLLLL